MYDTKMFVATPERSNVRYFVHTIESRKLAVSCINYRKFKGEML